MVNTSALPAVVPAFLLQLYVVPLNEASPKTVQRSREKFRARILYFLVSTIFYLALSPLYPLRLPHPPSHTTSHAILLVPLPCASRSRDPTHSSPAPSGLLLARPGIRIIHQPSPMLTVTPAVLTATAIV
jgi:hypothetical protein